MGQISFNTTLAAGQIATRRSIVLKRNTFPTVRACYYYDGHGWNGLACGPNSSDVTLTFFTQYNGYPIVSSADYSGLNVIGATKSGVVTAMPYAVSFAISPQAPSGGPIITLDCWGEDAGWTVTRAATGGNSTYVYTTPTPVYISFNSHEGMETLVASADAPADHDGDGISDALDPDDDNDGTPDASDKFPLDPHESADTDNDGIGDNADTDDDNDGHPDTEDGFPYDPTKWEPDRDGDGVSDAQDKFPDNPNESADADGDGIGDNQDPDDHTQPPKDAGDGDNDDAGDGNGNPGGGDGGGGPGPGPGAPVPGTAPEGIGDQGSPGALPQRPKSYGDSKVTTTPQSISGWSQAPQLTTEAAQGLGNSTRLMGEDMKSILGNWHPFQGWGGVGGGDLTSYSITTSAFGTATIPLPVSPESIGVFRACCLFAMYWGYVLHAMRLMRI